MEPLVKLILGNPVFPAAGLELLKEALPGVWSLVRQRAYQQLFAESTIVRRY